MDSTKLKVGQHHGKLVSFEGDYETISQQFRLLPPSQKILILPSVLDSIPQEDNNAFNAHRYVHDVYKTFTGHVEIATSFLSSSSTAHPRLVFMNGGSIGATALCISKICEYVTKGDLEKARRIFETVTSNGRGSDEDDESESKKYSAKWEVPKGEARTKSKGNPVLRQR